MFKDANVETLLNRLSSLPSRHATRSGKMRGLKSLQSGLSIARGRFRMFRVFLAILVSVTLMAICIENGLHTAFLALIPLIVAATNRSDYGSPFLFGSTAVWNVAFAAYLLVFPLGSVALAGSGVSLNSLPPFLLYFTFGLLMVRIVSPLSDRNISQVLLLSVAIVFVNCILTNHILFGLILPFYLFALMGTLLLFNFARSQPPAGEAARLDPASGSLASWYARLARYTAVIIAVSVLLFILLPRPFVVIPGLSGNIGGAMTQMQQRLTYRDMVNMAGRRRIAFKARIQYGKLPTPTYWRGRTLNQTDGRTWRAADEKKGMAQVLEWDSDKGTCYDIIPFRLNSGHLYVTGVVRGADGRGHQPLFITAAGEVLLQTAFEMADSYRVWSMDIPLPAPRLADPDDTDASEVPERIRRLALQWVGNTKTNKEKADALMAKFGTGFRYSLISPALPENVNPLEDFLFTSHTGNCEHFAGSLGLMLRAVGVPTRLVEGFAGFKEGSGPDELVIRFSLAHVWVEALLDNTHWTTLDPTPAAGRDDSGNFITRFMSDVYDRVDNMWIKNVIHFDRTDQARMIAFMQDLLGGHFELPFFSTIIGKLVVPLGVLLAIGSLGGVLFFVRRRRERADLSHIYLSTMKKLVRLGVLKTVHPWYELNFREICEVVPQTRDMVDRFREMYLAGRFGKVEDVSAEDLIKCGEELLQTVRSRS